MAVIAMNLKTIKVDTVTSRLLILFLSVALLSACAQQPYQPDGRRLSGAEIEGLFTGRTFTLIGMKSGNELLAYARGNACTMRYVGGERTRTVRWFVRNGQHCCIKKGEEACGPVYDMGQGVYYKVTEGRHSHTMKNFVEGDQL